MHTIPVVLICYNRPEHTATVLAALREYNAANLIIFSDAPRIPEHEAGVQKTRRLIADISWTVPDIIFQTKNQGLARSIISAADYALEKYDSFILLEDDCVPQRYFFDFMYHCLIRYRDDDQVFGICGYTVTVPPDIREKYPYDAYFYPRIGSWGWATWKRAWRHYDRDLGKLWQATREAGIDLLQGGGDIPASVHRHLAGELRDVWTLNWVLATYLNRAYYIYPTVSHIKNIGCDGTGVHCGKTSAFESEIATHPPRRFPEQVELYPPLIRNYNAIFGPVMAPLRLVQLNTLDRFGGAAGIATSLHRFFKGRGAESTLVVGTKLGTEPATIELGKAVRQMVDNQSLLRRKASNGVMAALHLRRRLEAAMGREDLGAPESRFLDRLLPDSPDVVLCHNLHGGYFDLRALPALAQRYPVVLLLHDPWLLAGHCAHSFDCDRWTSGCGNCPYPDIQYALQRDSSHDNWLRKQRIYSSCRLYVVTPSYWLMERVERSILKPAMIRGQVINNGVDQTVFHPGSRESARRELGIGPADQVVLFAANGIRESAWKDYAAMRCAVAGVSACADRPLRFIAVGEEAPPEQAGAATITFVPYRSATELARYYQAADLYLHGARAENFPTTVLEALSCGLPVVATAVGGIPEQVRGLRHDGDESGLNRYAPEEATGILTAPGDGAALSHAVGLLLRESSLRRQLAASAVQDARKRFNLETMGQRYLDFFTAIIHEKKEFLQVQNGA
jgi:glycosyltransferase involved in cell wall biosynthesis